MSTIFTPLSHAKFLNLIDEQQKRVKSVGSEVGQEAGMNCDWHDNFGFEEARRRLDQESQRLAEMLDIARNATLYDIRDQCDFVAIGNTVRFEIDGKPRSITIGAYGETDPKNGLVSYDSPIARNLLRGRVGEVREISQGGRQMELEILEILPPKAKYQFLVQALFGANHDDRSEPPPSNS